jgi:hypothetical protein
MVFLLEEPSARDLLQGLLPRILPPGIHVQYLVFEGKQDLEKQLVGKMKGWRVPESAFVVLRDQDAADCHDVKRRLTDLVQQSGRRPSLVRVACRELESWVIGDWQAVADAFEQPKLAAQSVKEAHREPDRIVRPVETLRQFVPEYQKRDGARRIGLLLDPARNRSRSFVAFCAGIAKLVEEIA